MSNCEFCRIIAGLTPAEVIYETEATLAFFPLEPATRGHTMVIPKRHIDNFLDLDLQDIPELGTVLMLVGRALRSVLTPEGMNLISSAGSVANQSVMHMHIHLVPRWSSDAIGEIWPPKVSTPDRVLEETADAIREFCRSEHLEDRNPN
jgi:histidine triad (HIT) family protein